MVEQMFSALRGDWNIVKKNRDKIIALRRYTTPFRTAKSRTP